MKCPKCGEAMYILGTQLGGERYFSCDKCNLTMPESQLKDCWKNNAVNHPPHYETSKYECIEVMTEVFGQDAVKDFCLLNAFKYLYRCRSKHDSPVEDCEKAVWYINKFLEMEKGEEK